DNRAAPRAGRGHPGARRLARRCGGRGVGCDWSGKDERAMSAHNCETCPGHAEMASLGAAVGGFDRVVALAGNPNTGKSTLFNALTGLRQHTGNWPGKTVTRAEGGFELAGVRYKLVDLPGTYSLLSASQD